MVFVQLTKEKTRCNWLLTVMSRRKPSSNHKGKSKMEKIVVRLKLLVEDIDYIASDQTMRINGKSLVQQEYIPLNSFHR